MNRDDFSFQNGSKIKNMDCFAFGDSVHWGHISKSKMVKVSATNQKKSELKKN